MIPIASREVMAAIGKSYADLAELFAQLSEQDWDHRVDRGDLPDRVVGLAEAATRLGVTRSWLTRSANWRRMGGYLGPDRRVKFAESALRARLLEASNHPYKLLDRDGA